MGKKIGTLIKTCLDFQSVSFNVFITQSVKLVHPDPQVGGLQQILHLLGVGIKSRTVDVDVGREHTVDDRAQGTRHNL